MTDFEQQLQSILDRLYTCGKHENTKGQDYLDTCIEPIQAFDKILKLTGHKGVQDIVTRDFPPDDMEAIVQKRVTEARIAERKQLALDLYEGHTFFENTNYKNRFEKFVRNNEKRMKELSR